MKQFSISNILHGSHDDRATAGMSGLPSVSPAAGLTGAAILPVLLMADAAGAWPFHEIFTVAIACAAMAVAVVVGWAGSRQRTYVARLERLVALDDLTGIANRRTFVERLAREFVRARRYHRPLSVVLLDVDRFKLINDTHGHVAGDAVLASLGRVLSGVVRDSDLAARLGGDEFAILLPEADAAAATLTVDRLKALLESTVLVTLPDGAAVRARVSAGIACLTRSMRDESALLEAADVALYAQKRAGRRSVARTATQLTNHASRPIATPTRPLPAGPGVGIARFHVLAGDQPPRPTSSTTSPPLVKITGRPSRVLAIPGAISSVIS